MAFAAPIWSSGFRPFFLGGAVYGPMVMFSWLLAYSGGPTVFGFAIPTNLWHGHELLAGYGIAVITGFVITGVPSWAEVKPITGGRLAILFGAWILGRIGMWGAAVIPPEIVAAMDLVYYVLLIGFVWRSLSDDEPKYPGFKLLIPILFLFLYANILFHWGVVETDYARAALGEEFYLYTIVILYTLVGGFLTPIFTENELYESHGWTGRIVFRPGLEAASAIAVITFAWTGIYMPGTVWAGAAAAVCLLCHAIRFARWRGLQVSDVPLLWVMHLSYVWFLAFIALRMMADFGFDVPKTAYIHAFTVGAFGLMKIGFLTRVVLRHTGRPLDPAGLMVFGFGLMFLAAVLRLLASFGIAPASLMGLSAACWMAPFLFYLLLYGRYLVQPSLPYEPARQARIVKNP